MINFGKGLFMGLRLVLFLYSPLCSDFAQRNGEEVKLLFEARYDLWREWIAEHGVSKYSSIVRTGDLYDNEPFRQVIELGTSVIPYIMEKLQKDHALGYALSEITRFEWHVRREGNWPKACV
ncbi:MAG: hypothetical protein QHH07_10410 [Sedimentisphaerales bacterium]|jgi:hypothetical protein|nr:hypothetical protein [Sedimentisphaerales bacterium]